MRRVHLLILLLAGALWFAGCTESRQSRLIQAAEELLTANRYREAADALKRAVNLNPESKVAVKALYKLGFALEIYLKDYEGALFNYREFVRLSPDRVSIYEVQKRIANILYDRSYDPEKIIEAYKKLISLNPDSPEIDQFQYRIAQAHFQQNNFEQARYEFQELVQKYPKSSLIPRARFEVGNAYYMESKYDLAKEALKHVIRNHPQTQQAVEAEFLIAECFEHENRLGEALQHYEAIQSKYPTPEVIQLRIEGIKKRTKMKR